MDTVIYQPYVYCWTNIGNNKYYIGSRTARFAHPLDGYICSSKVVKELIRKNPSIWRKSILYIGQSKEQTIEREYNELLKRDAAHDPMSYNMTNGRKDFVFKAHTDASKEKLSIAHKGKPANNKGKPHSAETRKRISEALIKRVLDPLLFLS
jgi:hypothetical protein